MSTLNPMMFVPTRKVRVYGPHYSEEVDMPVSQVSKTMSNTSNAEAAAASLLNKESSTQETQGIIRPIGPGQALTIKDDSHFIIMNQLRKELAELPNAFDPVTGKVNKENDRAVMLYAMIQVGLTLSEFSTTWRYDINSR